MTDSQTSIGSKSLSAPAQLAQELQIRWQTGPLQQLASGHCAQIYGNEDLVLKVPFQGEEMTSGWRAALLFSGSIGPRVYRFDSESGSLLMERIKPGENLAGEPEEVALSVILRFSERIRGIQRSTVLNDDSKAVTGGSLSASPLLSRALGTADSPALMPRGILPLESYFEKPSTRTQALLESQTDRVLLHGDLHHENVILGPNGWVVIDAKGLWGDPAFEAAAFVRNPIAWIGEVENLETFLSERIERISAQTGCAADRIWGWSLVSLGEEEQTYPWNRVKQALMNLG